jgi:hypothetical protein
MQTILKTKKEPTRRLNWEAIINSTKTEIKPAKQSYRLFVKTTNTENLNNNVTDIETVCIKLKDDLEWHSGFSEKPKSTKNTENILEKPCIPNLYDKIVEKWWLVA